MTFEDFIIGTLYLLALFLLPPLFFYFEWHKLNKKYEAIGAKPTIFDYIETLIISVILLFSSTLIIMGLGLIYNYLSGKDIFELARQALQTSVETFLIG